MAEAIVNCQKGTLVEAIAMLSRFHGTMGLNRSSRMTFQPSAICTTARLQGLPGCPALKKHVLRWHAPPGHVQLSCAVGANRPTSMQQHRMLIGSHAANSTERSLRDVKRANLSAKLSKSQLSSSRTIKLLISPTLADISNLIS